MKKLIFRILGLYLDVLAIIAPSAAGSKGFLLFCRPFRVPLNKKHLSFLETAEKFTLDIDGVRVQGFRWGHGPKQILFLHGWQSHSYQWKPYIEALSKSEFTIYSVDAPGHGLSSGNFLSVPLYSTLIETFIRLHGQMHAVVGHSLGGFSLLYTLYRVPDLPIERTILLAPPGEARDFISVFQKTLNLSERTLQLIIKHFAKTYDVTPDFFSSRKFVEGLRVKGLIIHDEDDAEAPYEYAAPLQESWQYARLVTTKGFGHNLRSPVVVREVVNFLHEPADHVSLVSSAV
jgi:pimeloyl-ACP methyl ester carboxylesterase